MPRNHPGPRWSDTDDLAPTAAAPERHEVDDRWKWRLERVFANWEDWEQAFQAVEQQLPRLEDLRGTLAGGAASLLTALETIHAIQRRLEVLSVYASMRNDEDTRISENTARRGRAGSLATQFAEAVSWFEPELLAVDDAVIDGFLQENEKLRLYAHHLDDLRRSRKHTLDADREALLAAAGNVTRGASRIFSALTDADLQFPDDPGRGRSRGRADQGALLQVPQVQGPPACAARPSRNSSTPTAA